LADLSDFMKPIYVISQVCIYVKGVLLKFWRSVLLCNIIENSFDFHF